MNNNKIKPLMKNESGYSLAGVLLLTVLISVLGLTLVTLASNSVKTTTSDRRDQSAFYIAEAAATLEMTEIEEAVYTLSGEVEQTKGEKETINQMKDRFFHALPSKIVTQEPKASPIHFEEVFGDQPKASLEVVQINETDPSTYKMISTGTIGQQERIVEREFFVRWDTSETGESGSIPEPAALIKETITIKNGNINGNIGTAKKGAGSVVMEKGSGKINGVVYVPSGSENIAVTGQKEKVETAGQSHIHIPQLPPFPSFPDLIRSSGDLTSGTVTLTDPQKFGNIILKNNTLTFNVGDDHRKIIVDQISLHNGNINIEGSGTLTIFLLNNLEIKGGNSSVNLGGSPGQLNIFVKKGNGQTIILEGLTMKASLYAEDANIVLNQNGSFHGNIFTGGIHFTMENGNTQARGLFVAPNAHFDHRHGTIIGTVIAHSYNIEGILNYEKMQSQGPISIEDLFGGGSATDRPGDLHIHKKPLKER
ncbi:pilus assembly PilX N-terminal domain-containing protein [Siminovitchia sediminis]|uniref:Pilus assembly PilX N-terminal domain-containing protein n=1 Tax=Siminovitchia sediminis TaxID=1274353 RepID=A0ABW4KM05_9BACI